MGHATFLPALSGWRFYNSDGTHATATPMEAEDTDVTYDIDDGTISFHFRYQLQETGGASGASTDDYGVEIDHNGGGYAAPDAFSAIVPDSDGLVDGASTDRRLSVGSGSFINGEQVEANNIVDNHQLTASNFTDHVVMYTILFDRVSAGDTIDFRITLNGGAPGMAQTVTPRLDVIDSGAPAASRRVVVVS